jgi:hypothetical protein
MGCFEGFYGPFLLTSVREVTGMRDEKGRFIKGSSGNPGGSPKISISITKQLVEKLEKDGCKDLDEITDKIIKLAKNGNEQMIKYLWERIDGKLKETIDVNAKVNNFAEWVKENSE